MNRPPRSSVAARLLACGQCLSRVALVACLLRGSAATAEPAPANADAITVTETADQIRIETDALSATVRKTGYVSGIAVGSLVDKATGAHDLGFGLHIMDFLMAPGWRDDGYERTPALHGDLPKHYVEGPQICTQAQRLPAEVLRGTTVEGGEFVAVRLRFTFTDAGAGYAAGSTWRQTLVFQPGLRYVLTAEEITSANAVDQLFYRIDMPGHIRHGGKADETFSQVYLSYVSEPIPATAFAAPFAPDARFLYQRSEAAVPPRMIRAYQVQQAGEPGPWLAGMTLDPAAVAEAWCHERGYVCLIQELHRRPVAAGETFGAAYAVGWFDDIPAMQQTYDRLRGIRGVQIQDGRLTLLRTAAP